MREDDAAYQRAAAVLAAATALVVTAGAGMSADCGLPTFRDEGGLWREPSPVRMPGVTPNSFDSEPERAWGLYARMRKMYLAASPHDGYRILLDWAQRKRDGYFVFTSNVDEMFQKCGFDPSRIVECHGSLSRLQCHERCTDETFPLTVDLAVDPETGRALPPLPTCPRCQSLARPNVLLFYDFWWIGQRMDSQLDAMEAWLATLPPDSSLVVLELGAGIVVPSVRVHGENVARRRGGNFIRINPDEWATDIPNGIGLQAPALQALTVLSATCRG